MLRTVGPGAPLSPPNRDEPIGIWTFGLAVITALDLFKHNGHFQPNSTYYLDETAAQSTAVASVTFLVPHALQTRTETGTLNPQTWKRTCWHGTELTLIQVLESSFNHQIRANHFQNINHFRGNSGNKQIGICRLVINSDSIREFQNSSLFACQSVSSCSTSHWSGWMLLKEPSKPNWNLNWKILFITFATWRGREGAAARWTGDVSAKETTTTKVPRKRNWIFIYTATSRKKAQPNERTSTTTKKNQLQVIINKRQTETKQKQNKKKQKRRREERRKRKKKSLKFKCDRARWWRFH